jgi:hypothetical protein
VTTPDGTPAPDALRELVREVLRDVLPALADQNGSPPAIAPFKPPATSSAPPAGTPTPSAPAMSSSAPPLSHAVPPTPPTSEPAPSRPAGMTGAAGAYETASGSGVTLQPVRLATNEDLHEFVLQIIRLADNPKRRRDLLAGRLRFTLASASFAPAPADFAKASASAAAPAPAGWPGNGRGSLIPADHGRAGASPGDHRIEKGAVTERAVQAAASAGARLVLGPRAVLTPLARDRARALGVPIEKER